MDKKIFLNRDVMNAYRSGKSMNDAIRQVFDSDIREKVAEDERLKNLSPFDLVMRDAGISKYSTMETLMNTAYQSGGVEANEWLFPAFVETTIREAIYADDILGYLCNTTIGVDSNIVKSASLDLLSDENKKAVKKMRVAEGTDLPIAKIRIGEKAITLWKHGRAIEMTYEAVRRMRIDLFTKQMGAIVRDIAFQNFDAAVDVLVNGDGNKNAATKLGTLANLDALTGEALGGYMLDYWFANHYVADTITMNKEKFKKLFGMTFDSSLTHGASAKLSFNFPQIGAQTLNVLCGDVPQIGSKDVILLSNRDMSLIRYEENGSNIQENQNFARNQTQLMTVSENSGYAINTVGSNMFIEFTA